MWKLDCKESWSPKNWCFWTMALEKTLETPLGARRPNQSILKEISPEYSLGDWCWSWSSNTLTTWFEELSLWKILRCCERSKAREGDNREWDGWTASPTEFEQAPRVGDGQGRLVCCSLWGHKDSDMTEWLFIVLNWTDYVQILVGENIFITFDCTFLLKCPFLQFSSFWGILLSHGFHAG